MNKVTELKKAYLNMLEITEQDALTNAEYVYKNLIVQDEDKQTYIGESLPAIVKIIEWYAENENSKPQIEGMMLPYLASIPENHKNDTIYYAMIEQSGYTDENGKEAFMMTKITNIEDLATNR